MKNTMRRWLLLSLLTSLGVSCSKEPTGNPVPPPIQSTTNAAETCSCPSSWSDGDEPLYYYYRTESTEVGLLCEQWQLLEGGDGGVQYTIVSDPSSCCGTVFATAPQPSRAEAPRDTTRARRIRPPGDLDPIRP